MNSCYNCIFYRGSECMLGKFYVWYKNSRKSTCDFCVVQYVTRSWDEVNYVEGSGGYPIVGGYCNSCLFLSDSNYCRFLKRNVLSSASCDKYKKWVVLEDSIKKAMGFKEFEEDIKNTDTGCFLTTACVKYLGKSDDCYELTTMRKFRDEYLLNFAAGQALVKEYYRIAPLIVEEIEKRDDREKYYKKIYDCIQKCLDLYDTGHFTAVVEVYYQMVKYLKDELL